MTGRTNVQGFVCPSCGGNARAVKDARTMLSVNEALGVDAVVRARKCSDCGKRHRTVEVLYEDIGRIKSDNAKRWLSDKRVQAVIGEIMADEALK